MEVAEVSTETILSVKITSLGQYWKTLISEIEIQIFIPLSYNPGRAREPAKLNYLNIEIIITPLFPLEKLGSPFLMGMREY